MIKYQGEKVTPTQLAKLLVADKVSVAEEFWSEQLGWDDDLDQDAFESLTEKEKADIQNAIEKQADRVYKLLNYWELRDKVFNR